jgi:uncharacterized protein YodC (DUF2158 family)
MQNEELKVGDVVRLKSGSESMTIGDFNDHNEAGCYWFDVQTKDVKKRYIAPSALKKYETR